MAPTSTDMEGLAMTAPALVMVAPGSHDPKVQRIAHALRDQVALARPQVHPSVAFLDGAIPTLPQALSATQAAGVAEVVLVPLEIAHAIDLEPDFDAVVAAARADHPELRVSVARPIGPEAALLTVLDARLRCALATARVLELDGLILSAPSSGDVRGGALLARRARQWATHHRLPCLTAAADGSGPNVAQAMQGLRSQGRRHIAVGSFFLSPDEAWQKQADLAFRVGAVAVSEPLGLARELTDLVLARYAFAAMELLEFDEAGHHLGAMPTGLRFSA